MALTEVQVANVSATPLAVVRRRARQSELSRVVPESCGLVWSFLRANGMRGGRNVAVYLDGAITLEIGVEFEGTLPAGNEVVPSVTPAGPVVSVAHFGPYGQLGAAHQAVLDWCSTHDRRRAGPSWEVYGHWQDTWNSDPSQIRTDVFYQLAV